MFVNSLIRICYCSIFWFCSSMILLFSSIIWFISNTLFSNSWNILGKWFFSLFFQKFWILDKFHIAFFFFLNSLHLWYHEKRNKAVQVNNLFFWSKKTRIEEKTHFVLYYIVQWQFLFVMITWKVHTLMLHKINFSTWTKNDLIAGISDIKKDEYDEVMKQLPFLHISNKYKYMISLHDRKIFWFQT